MELWRWAEFIPQRDPASVHPSERARLSPCAQFEDKAYMIAENPLGVSGRRKKTEVGRTDP